MLLEKPSWLGLVSVGTGCTGTSPPGNWEHCAVGTDLLECSPSRPVEVKCVSCSTEMEDEGRHSAVINKCIQACLGLPNQLVPFPENIKEDGGEK